MNGLFYAVLEALLLVVALSMDAFVASFAYGAQRIKIPFSSAAIISVICTRSEEHTSELQSRE